MNVFSQQSCELGECPLWHPQRHSLFWLDILGKKLYEKRFASSNSNFDQQWLLPEYASFLATDRKDPDLLWMVTNKTFGQFDVKNGIYSPIFELPIGDDMRANDGGVSPDGYFWFGTMQWEPTGQLGRIYTISPSGEIQLHTPRIGIPNTFSWSPDGTRFYVSDSLEQIIREYPVVGDVIDWDNFKILADLSGTKATPDGGAMDETEHLWNAQWDGSRVIAYNREGAVAGTLMLPAPKPTSCCFGGPELKHLFITSATSDMSATELSNSPASGNVFVTERAIAGVPSNPFCMDA